jgi:hypothetical protein
MLYLFHSSLSFSLFDTQMLSQCMTTRWLDATTLHLHKVWLSMYLLIFQSQQIIASTYFTFYISLHSSYSFFTLSLRTYEYEEISLIYLQSHSGYDHGLRLDFILKILHPLGGLCVYYNAPDYCLGRLAFSKYLTQSHSSPSRPIAWIFLWLLALITKFVSRHTLCSLLLLWTQLNLGQLALTLIIPTISPSFIANKIT